MKPLVTLFCFIMLFLSASGQTPSSCISAPFLDSFYENDVKDMALERMYTIRTADTGLINIPEVYRDTVRKGLASIFNLDTTLQADSVFRLYCIHRFPNGYINTSVVVMVDTTYAWAMQWDSLHTITGYAPLDNFMTRYGFTVAYFYQLSGNNHYAIINTNMAINVHAFGDSLSLFPGVLNIDYSNGHIGQHNNIMYHADSFRYYNFFLGWGDCPSGCTSGKIWYYRVDNLCSVFLDSVTQVVNDPFPVPIDCYNKLHTQIVKDPTGITIYPNPANDVLNISVSGANELYYFLLTDIYGRKEREGIMGSSTAIDLSRLTKGMYIQQVRSREGGFYSRKVIKE